MEFGFCRLYGQNDSKITDFFREENNEDLFGLRAMNNRISEILFPECTTLMPNLVYIYYLNAIYHVLKEKNDFNMDDKKDMADLEAAIDHYETIISRYIVATIPPNEVSGKGFFNEAKERAYKKYKNKMNMLWYFDKEFKINEVNLLSVLRETPRYKFVEAVIEKIPDTDHRNRDEKYIEWLENCKNSCESEMKPAELDEVEKLDYIRRVLQSNNGRICEYSYTSNVIVYFLGKCCKQGFNTKIYQNKKSDKSPEEYTFKYNSLDEVVEQKTNMHEKDLYTFENIHEYGKNIKGEYGFRMYEYLRQAQRYSHIQYIAKLVYKWSLFQNEEEKRTEYAKKLKTEIEQYGEQFVKSDNRDYWKRRFKECEGFIKSQGEDPRLLECWKFIHKIDKILNRAGLLEENVNKDDMETEAVIKAIEAIVKERERAVQGASAKLSASLKNIVDNEDYIDTFRWEYRPTKRLDEEETRKNPKSSTMCVRYYMYELFKAYIV